MLTAEETRSGSVGKKIRNSITLEVCQLTFHFAAILETHMNMKQLHCIPI
jgi:hypothetical protein